MLYVMSHQTLLDRSEVKLLQSEAELERLRQAVICYSPQMKAPLTVAASQQDDSGISTGRVICHNTNCYKSVRQI